MFKRALLTAGIFASAFAYGQSFPNGVAAGDVTSDSAVLWARSSVNGEVRFIVAERGAWPPRVRIMGATVSDPTVPAKVDVGGLRPGHRYLYVVLAPNGDSMRGEFATPAATGKRGLRFGVSGDWRG